MSKRKSPVRLPKNPYAAETLRILVLLSCLSSFGRFRKSRLPEYARENSIDDAIDASLEQAIRLVASCLPEKKAKQILSKATAAGLRRDALDSGLSLREAKELAQ